MNVNVNVKDVEFYEYRVSISNLVVHFTSWSTLKLHYPLLHGDLLEVIAERTLGVSKWVVP